MECAHDEGEVIELEVEKLEKLIWPEVVEAFFWANLACRKMFFFVRVDSGERARRWL